MIAYQCDLCDRVRKCVLKEIDGLNYDICLECWARLEAKLKGKGKTRARDRSNVYLPPMKVDDRNDDGDQDSPFPGAPPRIWLASGVQ
jgi:hypothetical protein